MIYNIQPINFKANTGNLVPISEYKGPILKLTKNDKEQINVIQNQIIENETDIYKLNLYRKQAIKNKKLHDYYTYKILDIRTNIDILLEKIKSIKLNRLQKQINKCK